MSDGRSLFSFRLVKVEHSRCGEHDGTEYFLVPLDWEEESAQQIVLEVMGEMVADAKAVKDAPEAPAWSISYDAHPDKTVAEVKSLHLAQKAKYDDWKMHNEHLTRSFEARLDARGFIPLWKVEEDEHGIFDLSAYWGHNHGLTLNYGPPRRSDDD